VKTMRGFSAMVSHFKTSSPACGRGKGPIALAMG
jgi:hypothetical protein